MTSSMGWPGAPHQAAMLANASAEQFPARTTPLGTSPATDLRMCAHPQPTSSPPQRPQRGKKKTPAMPTAGVKPPTRQERGKGTTPATPLRGSAPEPLAPEVLVPQLHARQEEHGHLWDAVHGRRAQRLRMPISNLDPQHCLSGPMWSHLCWFPQHVHGLYTSTAHLAC
jgi:hypothetical protein